MLLNLTMQHIRDAGLAILPPEGGWVTVKGNPLAPRGYRLPNFGHDKTQVSHLSIFYGFDEEIPFDLKVRLNVSQREWDQLQPERRSWLIQEAMANLGIRQLQLTWLKLATPYPETVRFYQGEVVPCSLDLIDALLEDDCLEVVKFETDNPILDEATRDIIGSFQVDGLTYQQAQAQCLSLGIMESNQIKLPSHFYRPTGWYRDRFVEA